MPRYLFNGMFVQPDEPVLPDNSFSLMYGLGVFETLRYENSILFFNDHYTRLCAGLQALQIPVSDQLKKETLHETLLKAASVYNKPCRLKLMVLANYNDPDCIIIPNELPAIESSLSVDFSNEIRLHPSPFSSFKHNNYLPFISAANEAKQRGLDDVILLNTQQNVAESSISNVFCKIDEQWWTPPVSDGCIDGIYRKQILHSVDQLGITILEKSISKDMLMNAEEIFLTNVIRGVRIVGNLGEKQLSINEATAIKEKMKQLLGY